MLQKTLIAAAQAGGLVMKEYFHKHFSISNKEGINNLVTEVDHKSEDTIIRTIREFFPDHFILSEETGELPQNSRYKWIVDPIDGTVNYANGIPICCVSIAIEVDGIVEMGAVYNPFLEEFYFAEKGKGATLNNMPIYVSQKMEVATSCLATGFPYIYKDEKNSPLQVFEGLIKKGIPIRRLGSAAMDLCWVAAGRFDGFYEHKLQPWDSAAGFLMVEEAGGTVTNFSGEKYSPYHSYIVATNGKIHPELLDIINGKQ